MAVCNPQEDTRTITHMSMEVLPMAAAAAKLGVAHQTLDYYRRRGKLTAVQAGTIWLVDPEVAKQELEAAGFYHRREVVRNRKKRAQKEIQQARPNKRKRQP